VKHLQVAPAELKKYRNSCCSWQLHRKHSPGARLAEAMEARQFAAPAGGAAVRGPGGNWAARGPGGNVAYGHSYGGAYHGGAYHGAY
jgi:hypothetical protein